MENIQKFRKKGKKLGEYMMTKLRLLRDQKKYRSRGVTLKYMLDRVDSRDLIIVFSSCTRKGIRARYNYVRTLKEVPCNKLFLLDDFASDHRGSFYLGSNMNFGLDYPGSYMVVGGPQYFLGQSLLDTGNIEALKHIAGQVCKEKVEFLNEYLPKKVAANRYAPSQRIYLHYSDSEHTYEEHIRYLRRDLAKKGYRCSEDVAHYKEHGEISLYFPEFLLHSVEEILCRQSA